MSRATAEVSVIIAAFNAEPYIEDTCVSALNQTYGSLEIIVVDDGSTDGTSRVVSRLAARDPRLRLIRQQNLGVAAARNAAIAASRGRFIAPLDADDLWDPTKVERQVQRFEEGGAGIGMVYCGWAWIDLAGRVLDRSPHWAVEGRVLHQLAEVNFTGGASVPMFRRSCVEEAGGYNVNLRLQRCQGCEDWDLALRVAERHDVLAVPAVLVGYRRRTDSMSADFESMWRSQVEIIAALAARQPSLPEATLRRSSGQFALHLAGVAFWSRDYAAACRWVMRARSLSLLFSILPHVAGLFWRRLLARTTRPGVTAERGPFDGHLADPLIPYDEIYRRRWNTRRRGR
jgi:hypothetical protein